MPEEISISEFVGTRTANAYLAAGAAMDAGAMMEFIVARLYLDADVNQVTEWGVAYAKLAKLSRNLPMRLK
jgi:hypothetical protein